MTMRPDMAAPATVKGWCPGALRPMQTGDGLIVRVRPRTGALSARQALSLSEIARRYGNGLIDLTRRANLQIRGIDEDDLPAVWSALSESGLLDANAEAEAVRNVMVSPLAGIDATELCDVRPITAALETVLCETPSLWALPGKFGFIVDGGGLLSLDGERADIRLKAVSTPDGTRIAIGIDTTLNTEWLRLLPLDKAHTAAIELARAFISLTRLRGCTRIRHLDHVAVAVLREALAEHGMPYEAVVSNAGQDTRFGVIGADSEPIAVGIGTPFGRITAHDFSRLAETALDLGVGELRLSPWRALYAPVKNDAQTSSVLAAAKELGLVTAPGDPLMSVDACPGAPACPSAWADTRSAARKIAALMPLDGVVSVHVSGCTKGCARSRPADLVLVGNQSGFAIVRHGTAAAPPSALIDAAALHRLPDILRTGA